MLRELLPNEGVGFQDRNVIPDALLEAIQEPVSILYYNHSIYRTASIQLDNPSGQGLTRQ
jgi:hypothetical protein